MASVKKLATSLENLRNALEAYGNKAKFSDQFQYQAAPLNCNDLEYMVRLLESKIATYDFEALGEVEEVQFVLDDMADKADIITALHVPNLFSNEKSSESIVSYLYALELQVGGLVSDEDIKGAVVLPSELKRNVSVARKRLAEALEGLDGIESVLAEIKAAHGAAGNLQVTQSDLEEALAAAIGFRDDTKKSRDATEGLAGEAVRIRDAMKPTSEEAAAILKKASAAYRAATSQGLARSFSAKSLWLNVSIAIWATLLLGGLVIAGWLSYLRFPAILSAATGTPQWGTVFVHVVLGMLTVAPPLWLAWVATMQIGQRFRLAEDYGYKAALAAAYEGYRAEAAHLDPVFSAQLFAIALSRLDELPIRLVDKHVSGSPLHELIKSSEFKEALKKVPSLKDKLASVIRTSAPGAVSASSEELTPDSATSDKIQ